MATDLGSIGDLSVGFKVDMAGLDSGVSDAKAKLNSVGESAKKSSEKASEGMSGMLKNALSFAAGQAIFTGVGDAIGFVKDQITDTIKVTEDHQLVATQMVQALKSTHDASGMTAQSLQGLAESLSEITPYSQDSIESAQNLELTFTNIGKNVFPQTTQAILDVSQAMGQDLKSSAIQVGKALDDPAKGMSALQRIGVTFSQSQQDAIKHMIAMGNTAGAQKLILQELEKEFGGSAKAAGDTFPGKLDILKNKFEDLKIKVGDAVMPVLSKLLDLFDKTAMPIFTKVSDWFDKVGAPALQKFTDKGGALQPIIDGISSVFSDISSVAGPLGQDVEGFVQALEDGGQKGGPFKNILQDIHDMMPGIDGFVTTVGGDINQYLVPPIETLVGNLADWAGKGNGVNTILQTLGDVAGPVSQALGTLVGWVANLVGWLDGSGVGNVTLKAALYAVIGLFAVDKIKGFAGEVKSVGENVKGTIDQIGGIKDKLLEVLNWTKDTFMKGWNKLFGKGGEASQAADDTGASVEGIGTKAETAKTKVATATGEMDGDLKTTETQAATTSGTVGDIGKSAQTSATEVQAASGEEDLALTNVNNEAKGVSASLLAEGPAATTGGAEAKAGLSPLNGMLGSIAWLIGGLVGAKAQFDAVRGTNPLADIGKGNVGGALGWLISVGSPGGSLAFMLNELDLMNQDLQQMTGTGILGNIGNIWNTLTSGVGGPGGGHAHAMGGFSPVGELFSVGEQGPELGMAVPGGVQIFSNSQSKNMLSSAFSGGASFGAPVIQVSPIIQVTNIIDGQVMTDHIGQQMIKTVYKTGPVKAGV